jgi:tyrosyl-tRNA synthetase
VREPEEQLALLEAGVERLLPEGELLRKLREKRPLRVKLGVDPTAPDLHLGHTIGLTKLRQFQDLGHHAVLIIGDFTAKIGDPSGRSATRPALSDAEIRANAETYQAQAFRILSQERVEVRFNSEWFSAYRMDDVLRLCARYTVARVLERDDFGRRYAAGDPIGIHELLYPLLQGQDSVVVGADIEIGGTDQTFNILVGRELQRDPGTEGQVAVLMPILEGTDGTQKMSKSLGNAVGIQDAPREMFGKLLSISDEVMRRYYERLSRVSWADRATLHPLEAKKLLAWELVARFHGEAAATDAQGFFERRHQERQLADPEEHRVAPEADGGVGICKLLREIRFAPSTSEARRLVRQGAVRVDGETIRDVDYRFRIGTDSLVQVGRRRLARVQGGPASC